jgi:hypothetical protein
MGVIKDKYAGHFKGNPGQYQAILEIDRHIDRVFALVGKERFQFEDNPHLKPKNSAKAPPKAVFSVAGIDGKFITTVVNPQDVIAQSPTIARALALQGSNANHAPIIHQLQSATNTKFDLSSSLKEYGISSQLLWTDQDPNVIRFFRLRSSYDAKTWNDWQIFSSASTCGPVGVDSGLLRTAATASLNSGNTPNNQPLTQNGTSTRINVAQNTNNYGSAGDVIYNGGFVDPGVYGTFFVYCLDPKKVGGAVTYLATTSNPVITANDAVVYFGFITTSGGGGGTGSGGGSGPCPTVDVLITMANGSKKRVDELLAGDWVRSIFGEKEQVRYTALVPDIPCFRFKGENGLTLKGCSTWHDLQFDGGGFERALYIASGNRLDTEKGPTRVEREFIGHRTVVRIKLNGPSHTYLADGFYSHNLIKK